MASTVNLGPLKVGMVTEHIYYMASNYYFYVHSISRFLNTVNIDYWSRLAVEDADTHPWMQSKFSGEDDENFLGEFSTLLAYELIGPACIIHQGCKLVWRTEGGTKFLTMTDEPRASDIYYEPK